MHEIISVVDPGSPSVCAGHHLEVEAVDGGILAPGYYFVLWRERGQPPRRELAKHYFGPFPSPVEARLLLASALSLGLAAPTQLAQHVVECRTTARRPQTGVAAPLPPRPLGASGTPLAA